MRPDLLIAGRGFIARAVAAALPASRLRMVAHDAADAAALAGIRVALWGGRHPRLGQDGWRIGDDAETAFARACAEHEVHLISLGTRKVYASSADALHEDWPVAPADRYGEHKAKLEEALATLCGTRLTRLRLANIFGLEPGRGTFMAAICDGLRCHATIRFDMSPFTRRDFVPVEAAAGWIATLMRDPPGGIVNLGSGAALECGRLALATIEGFGRGRLVVDDARERDPFVLDVTRLRSLIPWAAPDNLAAARAVGRRLARL